MITRILLILLILLAIYILLTLHLYFFQSNFVFFPSKDMYVTPEDVNLKYKEIMFETKDGIKIYSWYIPFNKSSSVILFCHGNAGNISHRLDSIKIFHNLGLNTFIFDYRGYGKSEGKTTEIGTYLDVECAWDYLLEEMDVKSSDIILFGRSLGGSVASWLAQKKNPKALIVESCFTSIPDIGSELYPLFPIRLISRFKYNTEKYLKGVNCPVLIIHSKEDEIIPFDHGQKLFESAQYPKKFLQLQGSHNEGFILSQDSYMNNLKQFLTTL